MPNITEIAPTKLTGWIRPCLAHISTQFYRIAYLVCLKTMKTRMSAKMHFTIKLNLANNSFGSWTLLEFMI